MRKQFFVVVLISFFVMTGALSLFMVNTAYERETLASQRMYDLLLEYATDDMKETVNNIIKEIDIRREDAMSDIKSDMSLVSSNLHDLMYDEINTDADAIFICKKIENSFENFSISIVNKSTGKFAYTSNLDVDANSIYDKRTIESMTSMYDLREISDINEKYLCVLVAEDKTVEQITLEKMRTYLHIARFTNESYAWINGIINFDGGNDYAVRLVHPNLPSTEGMMLSTNMRDAAGNLPYQAELDGIKAKGELVQSYYFKKNDSDEVAKKISYAKLYKPYNWIIAIGVYYPDIDLLIAEQTQKSQEDLMTRIQFLLLSGFVMSALASILFVITERRYYKRTTLKYENEKKTLEDIAYIDALTNCINRRAMDNIMSQKYRNFMETKEIYSVIMADIDDFKKVNDVYGHDFGDIVLQKVAKLLNDGVRDEDYVCRWGGEEFLVLLNKTPLTAGYEIAERIRKSIQDDSLFQGEHKISVTISMGLTEVAAEDENEHFAVARADKAMYISKSSGKNSVNVG